MFLVSPCSWHLCFILEFMPTACCFRNTFPVCQGFLKNLAPYNSCALHACTPCQLDDLRSASSSSSKYASYTAAPGLLSARAAELAVGMQEWWWISSVSPELTLWDSNQSKAFDSMSSFYTFEPLICGVWHFLRCP